MPYPAPDPSLRLEMLEQLDRLGVWDASGRRLALEENVPVVIGRVCDAEPLMRTEEALARSAPDRVVRGIGALALLCGAQRLILAVGREQEDVVHRLTAAADGTRLEVVPVAATAPLDADALVCDLAQAAGKSVPAAGLRHCLVVDAVELCDIATALEGRWPAVRRTVTVAGAVARPAVVEAPLGTPLEELVERCGGATTPAWVPWHNGVLAGARADHEAAVELTTRGFVVLPSDHPLVVRATTPLTDQVARLASACEGCRACTDLCPVALEGGHLRPHLVLRAVATGWSAAASAADGAVLGALECRECGLCSAVCPGRLDPAAVIVDLACRLRERGMALAERFTLRPHPDRGGRRVAVRRLTDMMGLGADCAQDARPRPLIPERLVFALEGPSGSRRVPAVRQGAEVAAGDTLTLAPSGSREVDLRAPLAGRVIAVDPDDGVLVQVR